MTVPVRKAKAGPEPALVAAFERAMVHARVALPLALVAGAVIAGLTMGIASAILILAGGALVAAISVFWASVRTLLGETPLSGADAYAIGAPRGVEHEQKQAILRALKDLEFERSVGKISAEDYRELSSAYWAEGKRLLKEIDDEAKPRRAMVEALIEARLEEAGLRGEQTHDGEDDEDEASKGDEEVVGDEGGEQESGDGDGNGNGNEEADAEDEAAEDEAEKREKGHA
jgi:hypothetical protein